MNIFSTKYTFYTFINLHINNKNSFYLLTFYLKKLYTFYNYLHYYHLESSNICI